MHSSADEARFLEQLEVPTVSTAAQLAPAWMIASIPLPPSPLEVSADTGVATSFVQLMLLSELIVDWDAEADVVDDDDDASSSVVVSISPSEVVYSPVMTLPAPPEES